MGRVRKESFLTFFVFGARQHTQKDECLQLSFMQGIHEHCKVSGSAHKECKHPDIEEYRANANTRSARQSPVTFEQPLVPLENDTISVDQTVPKQEVIVQEGAFVQERQQPEKEKEDQDVTEIESISAQYLQYQQDFADY
jgi:hypothetical protein